MPAESRARRQCCPGEARDPDPQAPGAAAVEVGSAVREGLPAVAGGTRAPAPQGSPPARPQPSPGAEVGNRHTRDDSCAGESDSGETGLPAIGPCGRCRRSGGPAPSATGGQRSPSGVAVPVLRVGGFSVPGLAGLFSSSPWRRPCRSATGQGRPRPAGGSLLGSSGVSGTASLGYTFILTVPRARVRLRTARFAGHAGLQRPVHAGRSGRRRRCVVGSGVPRPPSTRGGLVARGHPVGCRDQQGPAPRPGLARPRRAPVGRRTVHALPRHRPDSGRRRRRSDGPAPSANAAMPSRSPTSRPARPNSPVTSMTSSDTRSRSSSPRPSRRSTSATTRSTRCARPSPPMSRRRRAPFSRTCARVLPLDVAEPAARHRPDALVVGRGHWLATTSGVPSGNATRPAARTPSRSPIAFSRRCSPMPSSTAIAAARSGSSRTGRRPAFGLPPVRGPQSHPTTRRPSRYPPASPWRPRPRRHALSTRIRRGQLPHRSTEAGGRVFSRPRGSRCAPRKWTWRDAMSDITVLWPTTRDSSGQGGPVPQRPGRIAVVGEAADGARPVAAADAPRPRCRPHGHPYAGHGRCRGDPPDLRPGEVAADKPIPRRRADDLQSR